MTIADLLLCHANGTPHVTDPRLAKVRPITSVSRKVFWCAVSEILTVVIRCYPLLSVVPRESPGERAREGHEPR
jgi:hypothetical protein